MTCVIAIPIYKSFEGLDTWELIAIQQAAKTLGNHSFALIHPEKMDLAAYIKFFRNFGIVPLSFSFNPGYFRSVMDYSRLMLTLSFYRRLDDFDYVLIYQTDAFIFEDRLDDWCLRDYSYIGSPWFAGYSPTENNQQLFAVGNGGFSLRKVSHCLKALKSFSFIYPIPVVVKSQLGKRRNLWLRNIAVVFKRILTGNNSFWLLNDFYKYNDDYNALQEDYFWGVICKRNFSWFRVPEPEEALNFGFEVNPAKMYSLNNFTLPMGCHAWNRYDLEFWKPHLTSLGYNL